MGKLSLMKLMASVFVAVGITFTGFITVANAQDISSWQHDVNEAIAKKQSYPRAALRKELEGKATVEINIDREGNIVAHTLKSSTGSDILDREVPKLLKRASPLPAPPAGASDSQLTMTVPLAWVLE
ncbi:MAG TPA: TonB family protein [Emcibacteraceae bacterium]|nr:TonB family protein [Emcibacteraceae bacterium]